MSLLEGMASVQALRRGLHLLARARGFIDGALGEARPSAMGSKVDALEVASWSVSRLTWPKNA